MTKEQFDAKMIKSYNEMLEGKGRPAKHFFDERYLNMKSITITVPKTVVEYIEPQDSKSELIRNAMILFPFIKNETISHGKAAQILGIHKLDLIALYGSLGIPYLDQKKDELENDISTLKGIR